MKNMNINRKIPAFTVMELMVTMVISGIVVMAALQFYIIFNKLIYQKNNTMEAGKEALQFYYVLKNDTDSAVSLTSSREGIMMQLPEKNFIQYEFFDKYVVRVLNNQSDTFRVKVTDLNSEKDQTTGYDNVIALEIENSKETFPILLEKTYTNDVLLNTTLFPNK